MAAILNTLRVYNAFYLVVDSDPSAGTGAKAGVGSMALTSSGDIYEKTGIADTAWTLKVPASHPVPQSQAVTSVSQFTSQSTTGNQWADITYSPSLNLFVAVAATGTNKIAISKDGLNWRFILSPSAAAHLSVTWSPKLRRFLITTFNSSPLTSSDGIVWTVQPGMSASYWFDCCWSPKLNLFCAVSLSGPGTGVATSPDGITWTAQTNPLSTNIYGVCWSPEREIFCAIKLGGSSNCAMTSPDGVNWTAHPLPNQQWYHIVWSKELGLFCAVSITGTNRCATSPDGVTWTLRAIPSANWRTVVWSAELGMFAAFGDSNSFAYSFNGINWTLGSTGIAGTNLWIAATWAKEPGYFVVGATSGTDRLIVSSFTQDFSNTFDPNAINYPITRTGAALTITPAYAFITTLFDSAVPVAVTVPSDTTQPLIKVGTKMKLVQQGVGTVTFSPDVGVTITSKGGVLASATQYQVMELEKTGSNAWLLSFSA